MLNIVRGQRPDLSPAQVIATLVAGVPIVSNLLRVFGVFDLGPEQQAALQDTLTWAGVLAGLLIGGDAIIRTARNVADAKVQAAVVQDAAAEAANPPTPEAVTDTGADRVPDADLPTDDEEFGAGR